MASETKFKEDRTRLIPKEMNINVNSKPWPVVEVQNVCDLIVDCVNKTAPTVDHITPYRMIRTTNIRSGKIDLTNCRYVETDTYEKWTRRAKVKAGDVLLTREAPIGEVGYVRYDDTTFLGQRIMQYRANPKVLDSRYLHYSFLSPALRYQFGVHEGSGSVVSHIRVGDCYKFKIPLPPLTEQTVIANILGTLDDKIDLNNQMNSTLEQIAQTLFKYWFIDFEFPDENGNPYKSSDGRMVDSELGEIPEGWEIKELKEFGEIICGKTPSKNKIEYYENGKVPFIKIPDMRNQTFPVKTEDKLSEIGAKTISKKKLPLLSVCVSCIATVGMICMTYEESSYTNQQINSIIPNEYGPYYLYFKMKELYDELNLWASGGSATLNLNTSEFSKIKIIAPPKEIINTFNDAIDPIFKEILSKSLEIVNLSDIRDSLLPKLMSGKIRVECQKWQRLF